MRINSPIIVVTCNYRLGVLGFLHSRELALDAALQDDVPRHFRSTANLGLLDVYKAFEWARQSNLFSTAGTNYFSFRSRATLPHSVEIRRILLELENQQGRVSRTD
jgi:Carboxylesterase family